MANFSFDIVSEVDMQEVDNAINQAQKELAQRYDFKGTKCSIEFNKAEKKMTLLADDDFKLKALQDIVEGRFAKRGVSIKSINYNTPDNAFSGSLKQVAEITSGLPKEKAKEVVSLIKNMGLKVQTQIEGEKLRVISAKKDDLQSVIAGLREANFSLPLQFTNFR